MKICPNCATPSADDAVFCTNCGTSLKDVPAAPAEPVAEPLQTEVLQPQAEPVQSEAMQPQVEPQPEPTQAQPQPEVIIQPQQQYQQSYQQSYQQNYQQQQYQQQYQQNYQQQYQQDYQQQQQYQPQPPVPPENDHTADFDADDISANKVVAMAAYLLGTIGIVIALLAAKESPYASFHSRQALKLLIVERLVQALTLALFWTILIPIAGLVCTAIVFVLRIICFFQVASGKAKDAPMIGAFPFLK